MTRVRVVMVLLMLGGPVLTFVQAQGPAIGKTTSVLAIRKAKAGIDRAEMARIAPQEIRALVRLYGDGKIQQWYSRSDGSGPVFVFNATSAAEARRIVDALPLAQAGLVEFELIELSPLAPLGQLIEMPPAK